MRVGSSGTTSAMKLEPKSGRLLLRMPISLHEYLANRAGGESVSLNMFICSVLAVEAGWRSRTQVREPQTLHELRHDIAWDMWRERARR